MSASPGLLGARRVRELLQAHGVRPRKSRGQSFVVDPNTIRKVIDVARLAPGDSVLEIGAGAGSLTLGLAAAARRVVAVEVDPRLIGALQEATAGAGNVEIVEGDARTMPLDRFEATVLVANLPYIAAQVVLRVLIEVPAIERLTVMTQLEVAERLAAPPGSRAYGVPSALVAYFGTAELAGRISQRAFYPVPRVDSALVTVRRRTRAEVLDRSFVFDVVRAAFGQRRKTLRQALATLAGSPDLAAAAVSAAGFDPAIRAEQVDIDGFVSIAARLQ